MPITLENCQITSYQLGVLDNGADAFDFSQLTSEPTAPAAGTDKDWIIVESYQLGDNAGTDGKGYVLTSIQHSTTDTSLVDQSGTEASSRLFVGNLMMNSEDSVPATSAHVAISLGDGKAIEAAGNHYGIGEWSDPAQPDGGTNISPWTTTHSSNSGNRANPDKFDCSELTQWASGTAQEGGVPKGGWIADVTYDSVEVLGQPTVAMETLTTAHEGFLI